VDIPRSGPDDRDLIIRGLRTEITEKDEEIRKLRKQVNVIEDGVRQLRGLLNPFHQFLMNVFGEMDAIGITEGATVRAETAPSRDESKWDAIKRRQSPRLAEAIDVLLAHGTMNMSQLAAALHIGKPNCSANVLPKLRAQGLITAGREFRLKDL
jgi:hypothetical protein